MIKRWFGFAQRALAVLISVMHALAGAAPEAALALPANPPGVAAAAAGCLDFRVALREAIRDNPRIGQAQERATRAEAQLKIARGDFRPQISAFSRLGQGDSFRAENQLDNRVGVRASQLLFDFGQANARRNAARARLEGAGYQRTQQVAEVATEAARHFLGIARAEERATAATEMSHFFRRRLETIDAQLSAGLIKRSEAAAIRAEATRGFAAEAEERLFAEQARTALRTLVQAEVECVDAGSAQAYLAATGPRSLKLALEGAIENAPELKAAQAVAKAAEFDLRQERKSQLPALRLGATAAYDLGIGSQPAGRSNRVGLDVSVPLYQGGQLSGETAVRAAEARSAAFAVDEARRQLIEQITLAWLRIEKLREIIRLQGEAVAALTAQSAALEEEYDSRLVTVNELTDSHRDEYQSRLVEIDSRHQLQLEQLNLVRDMGLLASLAETAP
jgi:outer membrane protein